MRSTGCRHMFCKDCWRGYISASVDAGPGVLDLRCPLPDCNAAVRIALRQMAARPAYGSRSASMFTVYSRCCVHMPYPRALLYGLSRCACVLSAR